MFRYSLIKSLSAVRSSNLLGKYCFSTTSVLKCPVNTESEEFKVHFPSVSRDHCSNIAKQSS